MIKVGEDKDYIYLMDYFEGQSVRFMQSKETGDTRINGDDVCRVLGLGESFEDFMGTDKGLDFINDWKRAHPGEPFFGTAAIRTFKK